MKPAMVIVSRIARLAGEQYEITILQSNGRKLSGLQGGTADEAAARAAMYAVEHCVKWGGQIVAPDAVMRRIPPDLRTVLAHALKYDLA